MIRYIYRLLITAAALLIITELIAYFGKWNLIPATYAGLLFLVAVTLLIHVFTFYSKGTDNAMIRRLMVGSMLRMFLGVLFLAISLFNIKPVNLFFVFSYCSYFCIFLVFEIWEMRTNLRPDSKPRTKDENA